MASSSSRLVLSRSSSARSFLDFSRASKDNRRFCWTAKLWLLASWVSRKVLRSSCSLACFSSSTAASFSFRMAISCALASCTSRRLFVSWSSLFFLSVSRVWRALRRVASRLPASLRT